MATLVSKVQLLRDLRCLQEEAKAEEIKRQESLMQSSSKVRAAAFGSYHILPMCFLNRLACRIPPIRYKSLFFFFYFFFFFCLNAPYERQFDGRILRYPARSYVRRFCMRAWERSLSQVMRYLTLLSYTPPPSPPPPSLITNTGNDILVSYVFRSCLCVRYCCH